MPDNPSTSFLPPTSQVHVLSYLDLLERITMTLKHPHDVLKKYKIINITHYKIFKKRSPQHELLVVTVSDGTPSPWLIRLERSAEVKGVAPLNVARASTDSDLKKLADVFAEDKELALLSTTKIPMSQSEIFTSRCDSLPRSILESSPTTAYDSVGLLPPGFKPDSTWTAVNEINPHFIYLHHLAIIAAVLHERDPIYTLLRHQCYWFAAMIIATVQQLEREFLFHTDEHRPGSPPVPLPAHQNAEVLTGYQKKSKNAKHLCGTFHRIRIVRAFPMMVDILWISTRERIKSWNEMVEKKMAEDKEEETKLVTILERNTHLENLLAKSETSVECFQRELKESRAEQKTGYNANSPMISQSTECNTVGCRLGRETMGGKSFA